MCGYCVEHLCFESEGNLLDVGPLGVIMFIQEDPDPVHAIAVAAERDHHEGPAALARLAEAFIGGLPLTAPHQDLALRTLTEVEPDLVSALHPCVDGDALVKVARSHLERFVAWWFGGGVRRRKVKMVNGVFDPITSVSMKNIERLGTMLPATIASLAALRRYGDASPGHQALLLTIVSSNSPGVPYFDGCDLWIQRRAMLDAFDCHRVGGLLDRATTIRPFLWAYLLHRRTVPSEAVLALDTAFGDGWQERL